jgi:phage/plasmid-associated DNA primase
MKDKDKDKGNIVPISEAKAGYSSNSRRGKSLGDGLSSFDRKSKQLNTQATRVENGELGENYHVVLMGDNSRHILRELKDKVVEYISTEYIVSMYLTKAVEDAKRDPSTPTRISEAQEIVNKFKNIVKPISEPKKVAFLSDPDMCFKRLPFDYDPNKTGYKHPTWDKMISNIKSNQKAFMCFIGSLFVEEADRQTYLWMVGEGGDGKGSVIRFLEKVLGDGVCVALTTPSRNTAKDSWNASLLGKKLGLFSECSNYKFPTSGHFLSLSGGDSIPINPKYIKPFTIKNDMRFIFASNVSPDIDGSPAACRRLVLVEFKDSSERVIDIDPDFEDKLFSEAQSFINFCMKMYYDKYPKHTAIICEDQDAIKGLASNNEAEFEDFFEDNFGIESEEDNEHWNGRDKYIYKTRSSVVTEIISRRFNPSQRKAFYAWMRREKKIFRRSIKINGAKKEGFYLRIKMPNERLN